VEFFRGKGQKLRNSLGVKPILLVDFCRGKQRFHKILQPGVNAFFFAKVVRVNLISYGSL